MHLIFLWGLIFTVKMFFGILKTSAILYLSLLHAQRVCSQTAGWGWVGRIEGMKSCYPGNMTNIPSYAKFPLQFHFLTAPYNKTFIPILLYLCAMMQNNSGGEHTWRESLASSMFWGPMQKICKVKDLRTIHWCLFWFRNCPFIFPWSSPVSACPAAVHKTEFRMFPLLPYETAQDQIYLFIF